MARPIVASVVILLFAAGCGSGDQSESGHAVGEGERANSASAEATLSLCSERWRFGDVVARALNENPDDLERDLRSFNPPSGFEGAFADAIRAAGDVEVSSGRKHPSTVILPLDEAGIGDYFAATPCDETGMPSDFGCQIADDCAQRLVVDIDDRGAATPIWTASFKLSETVISAVDRCYDADGGQVCEVTTIEDDREDTLILHFSRTIGGLYYAG